MRVRRSLLATTALLLAASLSACSGGSDDPEPEPKGASSDATTETEAEDPEPDWLAGQDWVQEPLDGDLDLVKTVAQPTYKSEYGTAEVDAAYTDDLILFGDTRANLYALDRETGKTLWHVRMKTSLPGGDTVCDLVVPSPEASVVVLNHGGGDLCGNFTAYDLETGKVVDDYESLSAEAEAIDFHLGDNSALWQLGERVYWMDADERLRVIEDDGSSSIVGSSTLALRGEKDYSVSYLQLIPGTDVFMARYREPSDGDLGTKVPGRKDGGLFGFRIDDEGGLELVWQRPMREITSEAVSPGFRGDNVYVQDELPGTVQDVAMIKGTKVLRLRGVDPETGQLHDPGVLAPYDGMEPGGVGVPAFARDYGPSLVLSVGEDTLFSPYEVPKRNGDTSLKRYDLTTGEEVWQWQVPGAMKAPYPPNMDVLAMTPDRSSVYVLTSIDFENLIWEIDYETGKPRQRWILPSVEPYRFDLDFAHTYLDGTDVFQVNATGYDDATLMAGLLRMGD